MGLREMAEQHGAGTGTVAEALDAAGAIGGAAREAAELPDLSGSPTAASDDVPVHVAWRRMMLDVQWLGKNRRTESGTKFNYRGIDDVMNLVGPAERRHGVFVMPTGVEPVFEVINTKGGAAMNYARIVCHFTIYGPRGDTMQATVLGEGFDSGDKSGTKAQSVALRTLYLNALAIQTNEPARDTEYGVQHEIAGPPVRTPADYVVEILADSTSVPRLRQIHAEIQAEPRLRSAEVEGLDGQRVGLSQLVVQIGAARRAAENAGAGGE